jgi:hypothetical protein
MLGGRNKITRLLKKKNVFQGTINGVAAIWQRPKQGKQSGGGYCTTGASGLKLLVAYESTVTCQPRFDFYGIGERSVKKNISIKMDKAIGRALRSAK